VLAVPIDKLCSLYRKIKSQQDLPELVLSQIAHFFRALQGSRARKMGQGRKMGRPGGRQAGDPQRREALQESREKTDV